MRINNTIFVYTTNQSLDALVLATADLVHV